MLDRVMEGLSQLTARTGPATLPIPQEPPRRPRTSPAAATNWRCCGAGSCRATGMCETAAGIDKVDLPCSHCDDPEAVGATREGGPGIGIVDVGCGSTSGSASIGCDPSPSSLSPSG